MLEMTNNRPSRHSRHATRNQPALLVIVGPTASGKSDLAMKIARKFDGEIICADSRTIYKGMNIGTAKPGIKDRKSISHWGLDLLEPGQKYSAAKFRAYAEDAIADIQSRGKLPILVGGTGLYIDAVLFQYSFVASRSRSVFGLLPNSVLRTIIKQRGWKMPENSTNRRHLLATIRRKGEGGSRSKIPPPGTLILGVAPNDEVLRRRIARRAEAMFDMGIINETRDLMQTYGQKALAGTAGIVYGIVVSQLRSEITQDQAVQLFKNADWQYARRQKTWFRRNPYINWFSSSSAAFEWLKKQSF